MTENKQDKMVSRVGFEPTPTTETPINWAEFEDSTAYLGNTASVASLTVTYPLRLDCFLCERVVSSGDLVISWRGRSFCSEACYQERLKLERQLDLLFGAKNDPSQPTNS